MPEQKVIFICAQITENLNTTRYQRSLMLLDNYEVALIYRISAPGELLGRFKHSYRLTGKVLFYFKGPFYIAYLSLFKGYRFVYSECWIHSIVWSFISKYLFGLKWIYDLWDHPNLEFSHGRSLIRRFKKAFFNTIAKGMLSYADVWIIAMGNGILDHMPRPGKKTKIIKVTNGVDLSCISDCLENAPSESPWGDSRNDFVNVAYAGFVIVERGLNLIIEFLDKFKGDRRLNLIMFGVTNTDALKKIEEHNKRSPHKINYLGYLPHCQSIRLIKASDVCLCLFDLSVINYRHSYPIKLFEYMAMGKPIIVTATQAICEIVEDGTNGFLVDQTAEGLQRAFDAYLATTESGAIGKLCENASKTAMKYQWRDINAKLKDELMPYITK